jgi:hypothetical protein
VTLPAADREAQAASYRTSDTPPSFFRRPGDIHAHVDGAQRVLDLLDLLSEIETNP